MLILRFFKWQKDSQKDEKPSKQSFSAYCFSFGITLVLIIFGTITISYVEGWSLFNSLYMTLITITTVGFGEIQTLSPKGRMLIILILAGGIISISIWVSTITRFVIEKELGRIFRRRRMDKDLKKLKDHVIICGAGETGRITIKEFIRSKQDFVLIEKNPDVINNFVKPCPTFSYLKVMPLKMKF